MISVRSRTPELAGTKLLDFATGIPGVLGYQRPGNGTRILALANFSDLAQKMPALTLSGFAAGALNVLTGNLVGLEQGIVLQPLQFVWLRVTPVSECFGSSEPRLALAGCPLYVPA